MANLLDIQISSNKRNNNEDVTKYYCYLGNWQQIMNTETGLLEWWFIRTLIQYQGTLITDIAPRTMQELILDIKTVLKSKYNLVDANFNGGHP